MPAAAVPVLKCPPGRDFTPCGLLSPYYATRPSTASRVGPDAITCIVADVVHA